MDFAIQIGRTIKGNRILIKCYEYLKSEFNLGVDDYYIV